MPFTQAEIDLVKREYGRVPTDGLARRLGGHHSVNAIRHLAKRLGVRSQRRWTSGQDKVLRDGWGNVRTCELAKRIGRSASALKQRAVKLGLNSSRYYTMADVALIKELYHSHTAAQIAVRIHGTPRAALAIYRMAYKLGLSKSARLPDELLMEVRQLHADGRTWREIATQLGIRFDTVKHLGQRLGLKTNRDKDSRRRGVAEQLRTLGLASPAELRTRAYRRFARECAWPEDLRPREVQILNVLAEHGPKSAMELAEAIGARTDRVNRFNGGSPVLLCGNGPGGTYTASLRRRGLVYYVTRYTTGRGKGKNRLPGLYMLTPEAVLIRERLLKERTHAKDIEPRGGARDGAAS